MYGLVTVEPVEAINPIPQANFIEQVIVAGQSVVAPKGLHAVGDLVVYYRPCYIPRKGFSFLNAYKAVLKLGRTKFLAYRIRKVRLQGTESNGFVVPLLKFVRYINKYYANDLLDGSHVYKTTFRAKDDVSLVAHALSHPKARVVHTYMSEALGANYNPIMEK